MGQFKTQNLHFKFKKWCWRTLKFIDLFLDTNVAFNAIQMLILFQSTILFSSQYNDNKFTEQSRKKALNEVYW